MTGGEVFIFIRKPEIIKPPRDFGGFLWAKSSVEWRFHATDCQIVLRIGKFHVSWGLMAVVLYFAFMLDDLTLYLV